MDLRLVPEKAACVELADEPSLEDLPLLQYRFHGKGIQTMDDHQRATHFEAKIFKYLLNLNGAYRTIEEISAATGVPQKSVGSHLRNLRMIGHGNHDTYPRLREGTNTWEYHLIPNPQGKRPVFLGMAFLFMYFLSIWGCSGNPAGIQATPTPTPSAISTPTTVPTVCDICNYVSCASGQCVTYTYTCNCH